MDLVLKRPLGSFHNKPVLRFPFRLYQLRFHLWLYNLSRKNSDKEKGLSNWFRTIGEEPIIYDEFLAGKSTDLLNNSESVDIFLKQSIPSGTLLRLYNAQAR